MIKTKSMLHGILQPALSTVSVSVVVLHNGDTLQADLHIFSVCFHYLSHVCMSFFFFFYYSYTTVYAGYRLLACACLYVCMQAYAVSNNKTKLN